MRAVEATENRVEIEHHDGDNHAEDPAGYLGRHVRSGISVGKLLVCAKPECHRPIGMSSRNPPNARISAAKTAPRAIALCSNTSPGSAESLSAMIADPYNSGRQKGRTDEFCREFLGESCHSFVLC